MVLALGLVAVSVTACFSTPSPATSSNQLVEQGLTAESQGQTQVAVTDFNNAITKNPANEYAYYDLGVIYQENLNEPANAEAEYNKALLAAPNYKPALFNLAILETPDDPQGAISLYSHLLSLNPNDANVNFNLGLLLIDQNQSTQGHLDLEKAIKIDPALAKKVPVGMTP